MMVELAYGESGWLKIEWPHPCIPRIGETIDVTNFAPKDDYQAGDEMVVTYINWGLDTVLIKVLTL